MPADPPISFQEKAQAAGNSASGGYPYQLSASDLDRNFVYATLDVEPNEFAQVEDFIGANGHPARRLKVNGLPPGYSSGNVIQWDGESWVPVAAPNTAGQLLQWTGTEWIAVAAPSTNGQLLQWQGGVWTPLDPPSEAGPFLMWGGSGWTYGPPPPSSLCALVSQGGQYSWLAIEPCPEA
jgi:hypothetical protein